MRTLPPFPRERFPIIPADWSPEQALATFELLNELIERIWTRYAQDIQALIRQQQYYDPSVADDSDPDQPPF
jgi:hypothetical protein